MNYLPPTECAALSGLDVYPRSVAVADGAVYFLGRDSEGQRRLGIIQPASEPFAPGTCGLDRTVPLDGQVLTVRLCPTDAPHAAALRAAFPHLRPQPLGLSPSAGFGDRLGLATPGHVRAMQGTLRFALGRAGITPVYAQQSIRENAGTSYLEALRTVAGVDPVLFREIFALARARYETDRASYHVSADGNQVPSPETLHDDDLPALLDDFHARQVLHVTFGSVLAVYGPRLRAALDAHEETYYAALAAHFQRHLAPFTAAM